ncbi:MAG: GNAT family N-acetyltransferase [Lachnospiraceae bacterium]|nr:GNAT family N-acetyltransferase [Lachnospiraceae bacterium]
MVVPYTSNKEKYLESTDIIDFNSKEISDLAELLFAESENSLDYIKNAYEYVRDRISHSADAGEDAVTCSASEVLAAGHGICFAKSHLLAALLRRKGIFCGFCYQKLILDDETAPVLIYHGLNGVYLAEYDKWIRLDARGNKEGVNAQFSVETEQLAFPIRPEKGEEDDFVVYPEPDAFVIKELKRNQSRAELWENLPMELAYHVFDELRYEEIAESHLDQLAQLYMETFNAAPWSDEWTFETARKRLQQLLHSEDSFGLCVYQGGQICGAVLGVLEQYFDGPMYNLHEYWVKNEMRGKGIGSKLFAEMEKRLLERGVKNIILITAKGDATEHFYHKQGMGTDPDMVFMTKRIGD